MIASWLKIGRYMHSCFILLMNKDPTVSCTSMETTHNLGQRVGDKLTNLSKKGFPMEYFTADFLRFFTQKRQKLAFGWAAGYLPSGINIPGIFFRSPNFLRS